MLDKKTGNIYCEKCKKLLVEQVIDKQYQTKNANITITKAIDREKHIFKNYKHYCEKCFKETN